MRLDAFRTIMQNRPISDIHTKAVAAGYKTQDTRRCSSILQSVLRSSSSATYLLLATVVSGAR